VRSFPRLCRGVSQNNHHFAHTNLEGLIGIRHLVGERLQHSINLFYALGQIDEDAGGCEADVGERIFPQKTEKRFQAPAADDVGRKMNGASSRG
jgi:hypothetical protein